MDQNQSVSSWKVQPLAPETSTVFASPDPTGISLRHPSIFALSSGKLLATVSLHGPGVKTLPGTKGKHAQHARWLQGQVLTSSDKGKTWTPCATYPFSDGVLFRDGPRLYILGQKGNLAITGSTDGGQTWSKSSDLTKPDTRGSRFIQGPTAALHTGTHLYLVAMALTNPHHKGDPASVLTPIILRGQAGTDLLQKRNWKLSYQDLLFRNWIPEQALHQLGIPAYTLTHPHDGERLAPGRWANHPGWHMAVPAQITNPTNRWHDPNKSTIHLLAACTTHQTNLASLLRVVEDKNGTLQFVPQTTPAGTHQTLLTLPGGHSTFAMIYDDESQHYWLISHQSTNSLSTIDTLPREHKGLPHNEHHRLQLHFSNNLVDWSFAGLIAVGKTLQETYYTPSLTIRGQDLCLVYAAGDQNDKHSPNTRRIAFQVIPQFRTLIY